MARGRWLRQRTCTFHFRDAQHVRPARPMRHRVTCSTADIIEQGTALKSIDMLGMRKRVALLSPPAPRPCVYPLPRPLVRAPQLLGDEADVRASGVAHQQVGVDGVVLLRPDQNRWVNLMNWLTRKRELGRRKRAAGRRRPCERRQAMLRKLPPGTCSTQVLQTFQPNRARPRPPFQYRSAS